MIDSKSEQQNDAALKPVWVLAERDYGEGTFTVASFLDCARKGMVWIVALAFIFTAVACARWAFVDRTFEASVVLNAVEESDIRSSLGGRLGGLASLAGLSLDVGSRKSEYVALLSSRVVIGQLVEEQNLLPLLFRSRWDANAKRWQETWLHKEPPTLQEGIRKFTRKILAVSEDSSSGLINVRVRWHDADQAAKMANRIVELVNERARRDTIQASRSEVQFLEKELSTTPTVQVKTAIYQLMESSLNKIMVANVQPQYALKVIDPAVPDHRRVVSPQPILEIPVAILLGAFTGMLVAVLRFSPSAAERNDEH